MKVLFLTNNSNTQQLVHKLSELEDVICESKRITLEDIKMIAPDFIISYNYKYLISNDIIIWMKEQIINLHTSFLPWNKGSYPNLWSFIQDTPKGVTIHYVNDQIDEGKIIVRKEVEFDEKRDTLESSYDILQNQVQELLLDNWEVIKIRNVKSFIATEIGSKHTIKQTDRYIQLIDDWNMTIEEFKKRVKMCRN